MGAYISRHGSVPEGHGRRLARSLLQMREEGGDKKHDGTVLDVGEFIISEVSLYFSSCSCSGIVLRSAVLLPAHHPSVYVVFTVACS